jgi:arsenate reductase
MAEGFLRHMAGNRFQVFSAGIYASTLNQDAVRVMNEVGIDIAGHQSKNLDQFRNEQVATVVTVCDHARQECPVFPGAPVTLHWSIEDPANAKGTPEERLVTFRRIRDEIERRVKEFVASR